MDIGRQLRVIIVEPEEVHVDPAPATPRPHEEPRALPLAEEADADVEEPLG